MAKTNYCIARVQTFTASENVSGGGILNEQRHIQRQNKNFDNMNVDLSRYDYNVHFIDREIFWEKTYLQILAEKEERGEVSRSGLRENAVVFDEMIIDVNTEYFEERGGFEFAKEFYEDMFSFACREYGYENIIDAVMHGDEINKAATEKYGHPVYHYHLHVVALPTVKKEKRRSQRWKIPEERGKVYKVINQISHSKHWPRVPVTDENGEQILTAKGKPMFRKSYSVLQDRLYEFIRSCGYNDIERGELGSDRAHLLVNEYKTKKEAERFEELRAEVKELEDISSDFRSVSVTEDELDKYGKETITGKVTMSKEHYADLIELGHEALASRPIIKKKDKLIEELKEKVSHLSDMIHGLRDAIGFWQERTLELLDRAFNSEMEYNSLYNACKDFITAMKRFPEKVKNFIGGLLALPIPENQKPKGKPKASEPEPIPKPVLTEDQKAEKDKKVAEEMTELKKRARSRGGWER